LLFVPTVLLFCLLPPICGLGLSFPPHITTILITDHLRFLTKMRVCASCERSLPLSSYTINQFKKGDGTSRCITCVHGHRSDITPEGKSSSGRYNNASGGFVQNEELARLFAQGSFRYVAEGRYTGGARKGQRNVVKWFKTGVVFEEEYFRLDIKAVDKAVEIVDRFNELDLINRFVRVNVPEVWTFKDDAGKLAGMKHLCEPFICNYEKFNSNSGWTDDSEARGQMMQALSHFSYHITGGQFVLCDLQGGVGRYEIILSDPVILSRTRQFGVTDLGAKGILSFFSLHECNDLCDPDWTKPAKTVQHLRPVMGTTMIGRDAVAGRAYGRGRGGH
jgi:hypothetical protein